MAPLSGRGRVDRPGAAALGPVRGVPEQPDARGDEGTLAAVVRHAARRRPCAATQSREDRGHRPGAGVVGPAGATRRARRARHSPRAATGAHLGLGDEESAHDRRRRLPTFFVRVGTDYAQSQTDADFIRKTLKATKVWIVDDSEPYSATIGPTGASGLHRERRARRTRDSASNRHSTDFSRAGRQGAASGRAGRLPAVAGRASTPQRLRASRARASASTHEAGWPGCWAPSGHPSFPT